MSKGLNITIMGKSANGTLVAAELIPLRRGRKTRRMALELGKTETIQDVPDGRYLLRLRLANGGTMACNVDVKKGAGEHAFDLDKRFSPNETAAWGYLVQPARRLLRGTALRQLSSKFSSGQQADFGFHSPDKFSKCSKLESFGVENAKADLEAQVFSQRQGPSLVMQGQLGLQPGIPCYRVDQNRMSASRDPNAVAEFMLKPMPAYAGSMPVMAIHDAPGVLGATSQPLWTCAVLPPDTKRLLVIYDQTKEGSESLRSSPWNLMPEMGDPHAMVLYNYLVGGHFNQARLVAEKYLMHAVDALAGKFQNLSAALIGGYYLLKMTPPWTRKRRKIAGVDAGKLTQWVDNLDRHFTYCADGAIINASQHLRCGRIQLARERFLEAARRGLPCSTLGARMLLDGLKLLAAGNGGGSDSEMHAVLNAIRPIYASMDWSSSFTTVRGQLLHEAGSAVLQPAEAIASAGNFQAAATATAY